MGNAKPIGRYPLACAQVQCPLLGPLPDSCAKLVHPKETSSQLVHLKESPSQLGYPIIQHGSHTGLPINEFFGNLTQMAWFCPIMTKMVEAGVISTKAKLSNNVLKITTAADLPPGEQLHARWTRADMSDL
ncbi:hypothetical protein VNO78_11079 [Psophocarpus tetragonolobus]|uniref:Uncharacterized protein n=1 Tax=Psophocarpus tetragonolobus TaxID=3891 RepID=A0AAN9SN99_PSOTE